MMAAVGAAALAVLASLVVPWDWVPNGELTPMAPSELFTSDQIARAEDFSSYRRLLSWSAYAVSLTVTFALGFTSLGARVIRRFTHRLSWWVAIGVAAFGLLLLGRVVVLPFSLLMRAQSLRYGLTNQPLSDWVIDQLKSLLLAWVITAVVLTLLAGLARRYPRRWFLPAGGLAALLIFAGSYLYPVVVEPLFNEFKPMAAGPFRASVFELAAREGIRLDDVLVADASRRTTTLNAYVSGLWGTRHVVVYDTLLEQMGPKQARVVIAHELAHAKNRDVLIGTGLAAVGALTVIPLLAVVLDAREVRRRIGISGAGDPAAVALLLAIFALGSLATSPLTNTVSRAIEVRADRDALSATRSDAAFIAVQRQLALKAVQDPTPPGWSQSWFGSHPTALQRAGLPASLEARE
jgi:STE24 endopeptidase